MMKDKNKLIIILEALLIFGIFIYYSVTVSIPELKSKFGSSDTLINTSNYKNMFELKINDTDFALVINKDYKIYHIIFLSDSAKAIYNQNIEKSSNNKEALKKVVELLISNDILKSNSQIEITKYDTVYYSKFIDILGDVLDEYEINRNYIEKDSTLKTLANSLSINYTDDKSFLRELDVYSKNFVMDTNINKKDNTEEVTMSDDTFKSLSNNVYKRIEEYVTKNNIVNLDKGNSDLIISLISADDDGLYFPDNNSWYYVSNSKIYAYIEFNNNEKIYGFCYNGSIDDNECNNEVVK